MIVEEAQEYVKGTNTPLFIEIGLRITGFDRSCEARVFDLDGHPFYMGTLFQPERSAFNDVAHPLIVAYMQAALAYTQASGHVI